MGVIQSAINQALGTAGIAARLSPGLEKRQELKNLEKQEKSLKARSDAAVEAIETKQKEGTIDLKSMQQDADILREAASDVEQLRKKQFELKPSPESYEKYVKSKGVVKESKSIGQDLQSAQEELRMQEAMNKVGRKQERQLKQKRNFMSYLKDQPTSFGGNVGDLPLKMQKAIAKQYSPAERKKLMNQMDKEKKDGTK